MVMAGTDSNSEEAKPEITKAVARGDLRAVQKIVERAAAATATASSNDEKIKTINQARKWTERSPAYQSEEDPDDATNNPDGIAEWFDVTPITTAAIRGHDAIVEYLLRQGADPTLKGCPKDDIELPNNDDVVDDDEDENEPLIDRPSLHMNAFDAASKLNRKIRCCRRTQDLLAVVKPYWKRAVYSGSSASRHKRTIFSNSPLGPEDNRLGWIVDALDGVPELKEYPLRVNDFNASIMDTCNDHRTSTSSNEAPIRKCSSCHEYKPAMSFSKNQKSKYGDKARCISCVANNPQDFANVPTLFSSTGTPICPKCKGAKLNSSICPVCQACMSRMANDPNNTMAATTTK